MIRHALAADGLSATTLDSAVRSIVRAAPSDAVLSIRVSGPLADAHWRVLSPARLRAFVPETMNLEIGPVEGFSRRVSDPDSGATRERIIRPLCGHRDESVASSIAQLSFY
jgi:hypothetical protein